MFFYRFISLISIFTIISSSLISFNAKAALNFVLWDLMNAIYLNQTTKVEFILEKNPELLTERNQAGQSALEYSRQLGRAEITNIITTQYPTYTAPAFTAAIATTGGGIGTTTLIIGGIAIAGGGALALGGGGGGGSGGGTPTPDVDDYVLPSLGAFPAAPETNSSATFDTTEAAANLALGSSGAGINAIPAYVSGYDGRIWDRNSDGTLVDTSADGFVKVAVIDSGVDLDHPDLDGNIITANSVDCLTTGCVAGGGDIDGHGTNVAGIIAAERNSTGLYGIAPQAQIMPIAAIDVTNGSDIAAIEYAVDNGAQVINASYGLSTFLGGIPIRETDDAGDENPLSASALRTLMTTTENGTDYLTEFQNMVTNKTIIVYSAGNDGYSEVGLLAGLPYYFTGSTFEGEASDAAAYATINPEGYDWEAYFATSISVDSSKEISSFSNRCGVARQWCIATIGENVFSTADGGGYASGIDGTSFSAPSLSGAIAVLLGAFPHLDPAQVLQLIFNTAEDLGETGIDDVYGYGLLDLNAAINPSISAWLVATSTNLSDGTTVEFDSSSISLSRSFGTSLTGLDRNVMFLDRWNKNYYVPLSTFFRESNNNGVGADFFLAKIDDKKSNLKAKISKDFSFNFSRKSHSQIDNNSNADAVYFRSDFKISEYEKFGFNFAFNSNSEDLDGINKSFLTENLGFSPASSNDVNYNNIGFSYTKGSNIIELNMAKSTFSSNGLEYSSSYESNDTFFFESNLSRKFSKNSKISLLTGLMIEEDSFLGSKSSGAFNIGDKSKTYYTGVAAETTFAGNLQIFGEFNIATSETQKANNSLVQNADGIISDSFKVGLKGDNFGVIASQPYSVSSGSLNLNIPTTINSQNQIGFDNYQLDISNNSRETNFEAFYNLEPNFFRGDLIGFNTIYRNNPNGIQGDEFINFVQYKLKLN